MMTHFQELGFRVKATRIFGLGERNGNFLLKPGNYTLLGTADADFNYDLGYGERQGYGQHPLLIMQLNGTKNTHFVGIYFGNQYASRVDISRVDGSATDSIIKFKTIGGNLDFYVFNGQQYEDVLMQYSELIGTPKMLPYWAHGFHVRTAAFKNEEMIKEALNQYQAFGFPL
jgi:alpha-glucosidase